MIRSLIQRSLVFGLALECGLITLCGWSQDTDGGRPPMLEVANLRVRHYQVQHVDADDLAEVASSMVGRQFYVKERGGIQGGAVRNIRVLGASVIVYDTEEAVERVLEALDSLDMPAQRSSRPGMLSSSSIQTLNYAPRYMSARAVADSLQSYARPITMSAAGGRITTIKNISLVSERNLVLIRETEAELGAIRQALEDVDKPEPQVFLTCYLVRSSKQSGAAENDTSGLPVELVRDLSKLLPNYAFRSTGLAMLRTSAAQEENVLVLTDEDQVTFRLSFLPVAYDSVEGSLRIAHCRLTQQRTGANDQILFTTTTVLRGNQYTVLGASGPDPLFVVIRAAPVL